jgi:hypothetical protein
VRREGNQPIVGRQKERMPKKRRKGKKEGKYQAIQIIVDWPHFSASSRL